MDISSISQGIGSSATDAYISNSLDLFSKPVIETGLKNGRNFYVRPVTMSDSGPYDFVIPAESPNQYIQLENTRLLGKVRIKKMNDTGIEPAATTQAAINAETADQQVSLTNLFPHSLFRSVEFEVNGKLINSLSSTHYPYKAMIETLTTYGSDVYDTKLKPYFYNPELTDSKATDIGTKYNLMTCPAARNLIKPAENLGLYSFYVPLHCDMMSSNRLTPPGCNIRIRLHRNPDNFSIWRQKGSTVEYKIEIVDLQLKVRKIEVSDAVANNHYERSKKEVMVFPFSRSQPKTFSIPAGDTRINIQGMFKGTLPNFIHLTMVNTKAFNGHWDRSPFHMEHFGMTNISLTKNGQPVPSIMHAPDWSGGATEEYNQLYGYTFDNCGLRNDNASHIITPKMYKQNKFFVSWDLSPDQTMSANDGPLHEEGDVSFSAQIEQHHESITVVVQGYYDSMYYISGEPREVIMEPLSMG